jgi:hypothetical protein
MFGSSQAFGYGGEAAAPTQAPKAARQEDKQTCIPVTVRILQDAVARHAESQEVLIHGVEASIVHLVGVVEALVQQSAVLEFQINDGSGRMKVRYYGSGSGSIEGLPGLANGRYVSIVGNLRTSPAAHVSAMSLQASVTADEVSYHMIEVAHAALRLRNPSKAAGLRVGLAVTDPITPAKGLGLGLTGSALSPAKDEAPPVPPAESQTLSMAPVAAQTPVKADLRSVVIDMLTKGKETVGEEGMTIASLLKTLTPGQAPTDKVKDVLSQLLEEGEVYTTIDDDHFAIF